MFLSGVKEILNLRQKIAPKLGFSVPDVTIKRSEGLGIGVKRSISVISTCLNEEAIVSPWLNSLLEQTLLPDEVVICDGGSSDLTAELIKKWKNEHPRLKVVLIISAGANIAKGRNEAVKTSFGEVLLFSDVGSLLDSEWVRELSLPFLSDKEASVSLGLSGIKSENQLAKAVSKLIVQDESEVIPEKYLASGRSIGVSREAFKKSGGFPEALTFAGEDTLFNIILRQKIQNGFYYSPRAIANWIPPTSAKQLWKMLFRYAKGDAEAGLFYEEYLSRISEISAILLGVGLAVLSLYYSISKKQYGIILVSLAALYFALSPLLAYQSKLKSFGISQKLLAPLIMMAAQASGFISGLLSSKK